MLRLLPVGVGVGYDSGSCLDGEEGDCAFVVGCGSFPVITSSLDSEERQLASS